MNVWKALKSTDENFKTFFSSLSPLFAFSEAVLVFSLFWAGSGVYIRKPIFSVFFASWIRGFRINTRTRGYQNHRDGARILEFFKPYESNGLNSPAVYRLQCINKLLPILAIMVNDPIFIALYLPSMVRIRFFSCRLIRVDIFFQFRYIYAFNGKNKKSR